MRWWHSWRMRVWERRARVLSGLVLALERAEKDYKNSYYTDKLHDAVCRRIEAQSAVEWHRGKSQPQKEQP